jgi:hypothetical protein
MRVARIALPFSYWPDILLPKIIQPPALRAGIKKRVGWQHVPTFVLLAFGRERQEREVSIALQ